MRSISHFFVPPPLRSEALSIHGVGLQEPMPPCLIDRPEGTGDQLFMFFPEPVLLLDRGVPRLFPAHTIIFWGSGEGHWYGNENGPWRHSWLHCDGDAVRKLLERCAIPLNQPITLGDPSVVDHYLWEIYREVTMHGQPLEQIVLNTLENWFLDVRRQMVGEDAVIPASFLALKQYMEMHFNEPLKVADLARRVNLSPSHFSVQFKSFFHLSPMEYLIELRLLNAANLLRDRNRSVLEVARSVGYGDAFHFSKQFKNRFGRPPRDMRLSGNDEREKTQGDFIEK